MQVEQAAAWAGAVVVLAAAGWAMRDHVRDGGHFLSAPLMLVVGALGAALFAAVLVVAAVVLAIVLIGGTLPAWFPLEFSA